MKYASLTALLILAAPLACAQDTPAAKNIILLIADGMGYNHLLAGNYYEHGEADAQPFQTWTHYGSSTYDHRGSYDPDQSGDFKYLKRSANDSAATASAMATGVITYRGAISVDPDKNPVKLITDYAEELGKSTGVVTSVLFNHATPAAFLAHAGSRREMDSIAEQMIQLSAAEVLMGCGHPEYDVDGNHTGGFEGDPDLDVASSYSRVGGKEVYDGLEAGTIGADADGDGKADPWTFIDSREEFQALMKGDTPDRVFGLAPVEATLQQQRSGDRLADAYAVPWIESMPRLAEMSLGALNVLDNNEKGFFLMIEGGAVDWASHANELGRMVEEQIDFHETVKAVTKWVEENSSWDETLVIITADHECGYLLGPDSDPDLNPIVNNGKGKMPGMEWHSPSHTNQLVPIYTKGPGSTLFENYLEGEDPNHGKYVHDAAVGKLMFEVLK